MTETPIYPRGATAAPDTIFPVLSLDRSRVRWDDYLTALTPVEERGGVLYKREDYFAPLGYGGINGSKLRQLLYLVARYEAESDAAALPRKYRGVLTGASVLSPQLSMAALVARHYQLPSTMVVGATNPKSCVKHENVAIAALAGAQFIFAPVAYNPALQRTVAELHALEKYRRGYRLCYGITTPEASTPGDVYAFHAVGALQTANIPPGARTLVMTAGSCNSCVSVLFGLATRRTNIERVVLLGIGPTRLAFIEERLRLIEKAGFDSPLRSLYRRLYHQHPQLEAEHQSDGRILLEHYDLHTTKFAAYSDRMPWSQDGIDFHPTYEGKAMTWLHADKSGGEWLIGSRDESVLFWIVGSAPSRAAMTEAFIKDGLL